MRYSHSLKQNTRPLLLASACLCGLACRYDGKTSQVEELTRLYEAGIILAVCPEVDGGLPVPRPPCELSEGRAKDRAGHDLTAQFLAGAELALNLALDHGIKYAILKDKSPSCGSSLIYDGSFSGKLVTGEGLAAALLRRNGVEVCHELNYRHLLRNLLAQP